MSTLKNAAAAISLLFSLLLPFPSLSLAQDASFPWTDKEKLVMPGKKAVPPQKDLQGEWKSVLDAQRTLNITNDAFVLADQSGKIAGSILESGANLIFREQGGSSCIVLWQLLGDGRLSLNSGEEIFHRPDKPAVPTTVTRQFGSQDCRFTVTIPSQLPMEEIEDGVRISSLEKDAAMLIISGKSDDTARKMAESMCKKLNGHDLTAVDGDTNAYTFAASISGAEVLQHIAKQDKQYILITLMGQYPKLVSYIKTVRIVKP